MFTHELDAAPPDGALLSIPLVGIVVPLVLLHGLGRGDVEVLHAAP
jgi:hypothetical protein